MPVTYEKILLGRRLRTAQAGRMRLIEAVYPSGRRLAPHAHEHGNISLILGGELEETVGCNSQLCSTSSVVVKPGGTVHSNHFGPCGARTLVIETRSLNLNRWHWFHVGPVCAAALRVYEAFRHDGSADKSESLQNAITELQGTIEDDLSCGPVISHPRWIERVHDCLHECFPQRISVDRLAREIDVHPVYLTRVFRARFGCAVTEYIQRLRVRNAAHRLACSADPICHVATSSGFADQAHMSRLFKREMGLTPARFRKLVQGN